MNDNDIKSSRLIVGLSRFLSTVLSPLLMPSYGVFLVLWGSFLSAQEVGSRATVLIVIFGITCILPIFFISALQHLRLVSDKRLTQRQERFYPYLFSLLCYVGACLYLARVHSPRWFIMFTIGGTAALLIVFIINLKWKISAHMAGIGGIVALIYTMHIQMLEAFNMKWVFIVSILLAGLLGTARIVLKRHDVYQVLAGALVGYFGVKLMMTLFG